MGYQRRSTWDSCSRVQPTMKLLVLSALAAMAMAEPEAKPGYFGLGYGLGYGLGGYYGGYRGHYIGKREADAEPGYLGLGYGYGLGGYYGGYRGHYIGKREAEADAGLYA